MNEYNEIVGPLGKICRFSFLEIEKKIKIPYLSICYTAGSHSCFTAWGLSGFSYPVPKGTKKREKKEKGKKQQLQF